MRKTPSSNFTEAKKPQDQAGHTEALRNDLVERLERLEPIFKEMQASLDRSFEPWIVKSILFLYFDPCLCGRERAAEWEARHKSLPRQERLIRSILDSFRSLLKEHLWFLRRLRIEDMLELIGEPLERELEVIHEEKRASNRRRAGWRRRLRAKCVAVSDAITALADYLVFAMPGSSRLHTFIGKMITEVTTPSCFACGKQHIFKNHQQVRKLDHYATSHGEDRASRRPRVTKEHEERLRAINSRLADSQLTDGERTDLMEEWATIVEIRAREQPLFLVRDLLRYAYERFVVRNPNWKDALDQQEASLRRKKHWLA